MADSHYVGSAQKIFFKILHNDRSQDVHESMVNGFSKKGFVRGKWTTFDVKLAHLTILDPR